MFTRAFGLSLLFAASSLATPVTPSLPVQWSVTTSDTSAPGISAIPGGGIYVASTGTYDTPSLTHYSSTGIQLWQTALQDQTRAYRVRSDSAGNAYVTGQTYGTADGPLVGTGDTFLRKYDSNGVKIWGTQVGTPMYDTPIGIAVTGAGESYILNDPWTTNYGQAAPNLQTELFHFSSSGSTLSRTQINPQSGTYPGFTSFDSDTLVRTHTGEFYAAFSQYTLTAPHVIGQQNYIAKMDSAGNPLWIKPVNVGSNIMGLAIDSSNNLILAAGQVMKFDPQGTLLWSSTMPTGGFYAVSVSDDDRIFVGGNSVSLGQGVVREYSEAGAIDSETSVALAGKSLRFESMAISGNQLYAAASVVTGNYNSNNLIVSFGALPEPSALLAGLAAISLLRRQRHA